MAVGTMQTKADSIVAWGNNGFNQTYDAPLGTDFSAVAAGVGSAYALRADGSIVAWGFDGNSQVSNTPQLDGYTALAANGYIDDYALSTTLDATGAIVAWGADFFGEVSNTPTGTGFTAVAAGDGTGYALDATGAIVAWGNDGNGQVSQAPTGTGFKALAGSVATGFALRADGSIVAWGDNSKGQVSQVPAGTGYKAITAGAYTAYALKADGSIVAWGDNTYNQVSQRPSGTGYKAIASGGFSAIALASDGSLRAWGDDSEGVVSNLPQGKTFTSIAAGIYNGYALSTVEPLRQHKMDVAQALQSLLPSGSTDRDIDQDIRNSIAYINASTSSSLWVNGDTLRYHDHLLCRGPLVFLYEEVAVAQLQDLISDINHDLKKDPNAPVNVAAAAQDSINRLVSIDIELAKIAVEDSTDAHGSSQLLKQAINNIAKAAAADKKGKYIQAIDYALVAWEEAELAVNIKTFRF